VLSPTDALTPWILGAVLVLLLAFMTFNAVRKNRRDYSTFKRQRSSKRRRKTFRKWLRQSFLNFGGAAVVVLVLSWQFIAPFQEAVEAWPWVEGARQIFSDSGWIGPAIVAALIALLVVGGVLGIFAARSEISNASEVPSIGDVQALLPRNRAELKWGAALAINAGVVEELLFRLALPALIFGVTGSAVAAVAASILIFGFLHIYQGLPGIVGSVVLGAAFMAIYLGTGSIVVAIVVHALFDLRSLVLIPVVVFGVHKELGNGASVVKKKIADDAPATTP
jgi:membrane protease YdiL (CAAX protease family)